MMTLIRKSWLNRFWRRSPAGAQPQPADGGARPHGPSASLRSPSLSSTSMAAPLPSAATRGQMVEFDITPTDPLLAYLLSVSSVVEVDKLHLESPTLRRLKETGVKMVVPLISQGELIGLLNLGPRRSEQEYSADDRRLLNTLAAQAAPALRVAQLARQQQAEARERERLAQELRVARVIQQTLLPKEIPALPGWQMAAHWQPARAVSGDFYDFIAYPDGRLGIIVGDVTDKGVPAALVMATTRSILRSAAERLVMPGAVLEQANNNLCPDIPPNMFVTCLYVLLDPRSGHLWYANAGHNIPYRRKGSITEGSVPAEHKVEELRARGMPLGLLPDMRYEERETDLVPGDQIILYSDGLIEAHNLSGEMFGFPRLRDLLARPICSRELISCLLQALADFTGPDWEQEDDVTFVSLERDPQPVTPAADDQQPAGAQRPIHSPGEESRRVLAEFSIASQPGNERQAMEQVAQAVAGLGLEAEQLERLKTAVAEATMNGMEHGNHYQPDLPVEIQVSLLDRDFPSRELSVCIRDHGGNQIIPQSETPDLDAKLAGLQSPRGWGLFLIKNMVDEMRVTSDETHHTVELILHLESEA